MSAPGWYPDPWMPTQWRWFDGMQWSGYVHVVSSVVTAPVLPTQPPASGPNASPAAWWWAGGTLIGVFVLSLLLAWLVNR